MFRVSFKPPREGKAREKNMSASIPWSKICKSEQAYLYSILDFGEVPYNSSVVSIPI